MKKNDRMLRELRTLEIRVLLGTLFGGGQTFLNYQKQVNYSFRVSASALGKPIFSRFQKLTERTMGYLAP